MATAVLSSLSACVLCTSVASAATISGTSADGDPVSAEADFTLGVGDTVNVKLTNTTPLTQSADELFTGLVFSISGLTPTMTSDTAVERTVANDGTFVDGGGPVDISWSLDDLGGGMWRLDFNPDAEHAIIGPPNGGNYAAANGSIKGNNGHNPFSAEMANFVLSVPGISLAPLPSVVVKQFLFGTGLTPVDGPITPGTGLEAPEPAGAVVLVLAGAILSAVRRRRIAR